jgi:hypothetical protein
MTLDNKTKDTNEWKEFLETGKGGKKAVAQRPRSPYKTPRKVSNRQRAALRRSSNG